MRTGVPALLLLAACTKDPPARTTQTPQPPDPPTTDVVALDAAPVGAAEPTCEDAMRAAGEHLAPFDEDELRGGIRVCEETPWSVEDRRCMVATTSRDDFNVCLGRIEYKGDDPYQRGIAEGRGEANVGLAMIEAGARAYLEAKGHFPIGSTELTPATSCCDKRKYKCTATPSAWEVAPWTDLGFTIAVDHGYRYAYESAGGKTFVARAHGDLDCDLTEVEYELRGTVAKDGTVGIEVLKPDRAD